MTDFNTLQEAIIHFNDFEICKNLMVQLRWPGGVVKCPQCSSDNVIYLGKNRVWKCYGKHAKPKFSLKTGTIFEDSKIGLEKWLPALWMVVNCKNGINSSELARALGVTQKTAWFMAHRLRFALKDGGFDLFSDEKEVKERRSLQDGPLTRWQQATDVQPSDRENRRIESTIDAVNRHSRGKRKTS